MSRNKKIVISGVVCLAVMITVTCSSFARRRVEQSFVTPDAAEYEVVSNRHTMKEPEEIKVNHLGTDGYELKMENERLELWYREEVRGIRIRDKKSGYVWGSIEADKTEGLNKTWSSIANALCTVEYFDEKYNVKKVSLADSGVTVKENWKDSKGSFQVNIKKAGISFSFTLSMNKDGISFDVDDETIKEKKDGLLKSVSFVPFLGAVNQDSVSGYLFIPDGCGALIRFAKSSSYTSGYSQKVYGQDMGIDQLTQVNDLVSTRTNDYLVDGTSVAVPVFGVVHGAGYHGVMSVIESGEEFSQIEAYPAGVVTDYNRVACVFNYRQMYTHPVGTNSGGVYRPQADRNHVQASLSVHLLDGNEASYSGMAVKYREMLQAQGVLDKERADQEIPLRLDVIGSEIAEGKLRNYTKTFTTTEEAENMLALLNKSGISNVTMFYQGWQKGGINGASYGETALNGKVGNKKAFKALEETLAKNGGYLYLTENVLTANKDQISLQKGVAQQISKQYQAFSRSNKTIMYSNYYVVKAEKLLKTLEKRLAQTNMYGTCFGELGYRLYSDYTKSAEYTRDEFENALLEVMEKKQENRIAFYTPNEYLWKYTDDYLDIPMNNSQYLYETDTVPFLQIVLKGQVDYFAPYANQSAYSNFDILKMVEYGAYPSFVVAAADNYELQDTPLVDYFSINFSDWEETICEVYEKVSAALNEMEGFTIEQHQVIADGVVRVDYSCGKSIYINYNEEEYQTENVQIPAGSYIIIRERGEANE